jgi:hypothetical protein
MALGALELGTDRQGRTEQYLIVSSQKEDQKGLKCHQLGQEPERRVFLAPFSQHRVSIFEQDDLPRHRMVGYRYSVLGISHVDTVCQRPSPDFC